MSRASRRRAAARAREATPANLPAVLSTPIATTHDGRDITRPYTQVLEEYRDQRLRGAVDWGAYDKVLEDDQVKSTYEQRVRAVVSREWDVLPGDAEDPRSVEAGDALKANLEQIGWDRVSEKMLYAPFYGIQIAELIWGPFEGRLGFTDIRVRHARRFRFDRDGKLRLLTNVNRHPGELMPDRKFWVVRAGATDDDEPYGRGLADWLYWPTVFKRNGIRFWNLFLDKFSLPPIKGTYRRGTSQEEINRLLGSMMALANDAGIAVPEGVLVEFMQVATSGINFADLPKYMDGAIAKIILSQTMTTDSGSSLSQAQVHAGVKLEVVKADADLLSDSFNAGPARWWTNINYGPDVASPRVVRLVDEEEDLAATAEVDEALKRLGWVRTEESFRDTFGDGYEPAGEVLPPDEQLALPAPGEQPAGKEFPEDGNIFSLKDRRASFAAAAAAIAERDMVDAIADAMAADGVELFAGMAAPIAGAVEAAESVEELERLLIGTLDQASLDHLTLRLARAGYTARLAAETGSDTGDDASFAAELATRSAAE